MKYVYLIYSESSILINANLVLNYDDDDELRNSRDYMIQIITDKLRNITLNELKTLVIDDVLDNPLLLLNELEIKSIFF